MIDAILSLHLAKELLVIIIAALPVAELRVAIPIAVHTLGFTWYYSFLLAIIGNILPVSFILLFLKAVTRILSHVPLFKKWLDGLFEITMQRSKIIQKYKHVGLLLFVATPLPITGAWTGSLAAVLLGISFKQAFFSIFFGILIAGVIVTCLTMLGWTGAIIAGIILCALTVSWLLKSLNKQNED